MSNIFSVEGTVISAPKPRANYNKRAEFLFGVTGSQNQLLFEGWTDRLQAEQLSVGDVARIAFGIQCRSWTSPQGEVKYFTSLQVENVEKLGDAQPLTHDADASAAMDDIPF